MIFSIFNKKIALYASLFLIFLSAIFLSYFRLLDNYELQILDIRFRLRPPIPVNKNIVIIEVGDDTIDALGKWPIARRYHAELVNTLTEAGAEAIVFDIFFSEESEEESDRLFQEAIKKSGRVYLPHVFNIAEKDGITVPVADKLQEKIIDKFERFAKGVGFINIIPDTDGKFRRVPPFIEYQKTLYPHVCFLVAMDYLDVKKHQVVIKPGNFVTLGNRVRVPLGSNSTILVNFPGKWENTFRHYSYIDIIKSRANSVIPERKAIVDLASLKGSVCFVGITATATSDAHPTPMGTLYPGVGVNASLFNSFLIEKFIQRASRLTNIIVLVALCLIAYVISRRAKTLFSFLFVFFFMLGYIILTILLFFTRGLWLDIFCPVTVMLFFYLGTTFAKYVNETHKIEILEKELSIAKTIQESFLPKESPKVPGIDIAAKMVTARQVGGDLYDFIKLGDKKLGIMIGDVSGKGIPAALYMAKVVSEFKSYAAEEMASQTMLKLNAQLVKEGGSGLFVTLSYIIFDTNSGSLSYSSGGHLPMIILRKGVSGVRLVDLKEGIPLGLFDGVFSEEKIKFEKGDTFVLYTDGVTEAMNSKGEMFDQERLVGLVKNSANSSAEETANLIQNEVKIFEGKKKQHDDITVIVIKVA